MSLPTASTTLSNSRPIDLPASTINYSISDLLTATMRGSINGHPVTRIVVGALTWPTFLMYTVVRSQTTVNFRLKSLFWGSLQGIFANLAHEKLEQKSTFFKEHKNVSLITAGLISSAIVTSAELSLSSGFHKDNSTTAGEKVLITALAIIFFAPIGSGAAWLGTQFQELALQYLKFKEEIVREDELRSSSNIEGNSSPICVQLNLSCFSKPSHNDFEIINIQENINNHEL